MGDKAVYISLSEAYDRAANERAKGFIVGFIVGLALLFLILGATGQIVFIEEAIQSAAPQAIQLHR